MAACPAPKCGIPHIARPGFRPALDGPARSAWGRETGTMSAMVVSLLTPTSVGQPQAPADHRFAYPTVRPLPRPAAARRDDPRTW